MNCYQCVYATTNPGTTHLRCRHPLVQQNLQLTDFTAMLQGKIPNNLIQLRKRMGIRLDPRGVQNGWADWPFQFDPLWVLTCDKYNPE